VLTQAINNDTQFLASQSVMDYSLLVGLDKECRELVVGIIGTCDIAICLLNSEFAETNSNFEVLAYSDPLIVILFQGISGFVLLIFEHKG
jgi:hypothetical protein